MHELRRFVTIGRPRDEVERRRRDPDTLRGAFAGIGRVDVDEKGRVRWRASGPGGVTVEAAAVAEFEEAPGDRGTEVTLRVRLRPTGGPLGRAAVGLVEAAPKAAAGKALRRFKSIVESGEAPTLERNPCARAA